MRRFRVCNRNTLSILAFSLLSTYVLSFLFEGQILYGLLGLFGMSTSSNIPLAMSAQFLGLLTSGFFIKSAARAKLTMLYGTGIAFITLIPFFFAPSLLWKVGLLLGGYSSGAAIAAWGYFLKIFTERKERLKTCADVLITSNIFMIVINFIAIRLTPYVGLVIVMLALIIGMLLTGRLKVDAALDGVTKKGSVQSTGRLKNAVLVLCLFIAVLTINSGIMYVVINPAFEHLTSLVSWYWAVPYIIALFVMRSLPWASRHSRVLYLGMAMMIGAFIAFMLLGRASLDYLVVNTLFLGACGFFDLFWWSILGNMLDYTEKPSFVFGIGLSANVLGVLAGSMIGRVARSTHLLTAEITVMGLTVVCVTLGVLPILNRYLVLLLKDQPYLLAFEAQDASTERSASYQAEALDPLTSREREVLEHLLAGKSNQEIAGALSVTVNTVKTHAKNIYSKYDVHSRAELISLLLKGRDS